MRGSRIASLGRSTLGCSSLGIYGESLSRAAGSLPPAPSKPTAESILAKMQAEQPALYEALMLWYDPKLQGITNEQIENDSIDNGYFLLRNLQGTATYNMRVYGMTGEEGDGYVNEDGELAFDGFDDYGETLSNIPFSTIEGLTGFNRVITGTSAVNVYATSTLNIYRVRTTTYNSPRYSLFGIESAAFAAGSDFAAEIHYPSDVIIVGEEQKQLARTTTNKIDNLLRIAYSNATIRVALNLVYFIIFSRDLTDTESEWVRDNMINY